VIQILHPALPGRGRLFAGPQPEAAAAGLAPLRAAGITTVVSLLEAERMTDLDGAYMRAGLSVVRFPIVDYGVPDDPAAFRRFLRDLLTRLEAGESLYLHCHGGLGRTGTALACLFVLRGESPATAVDTVRACYWAKAVETDAQRAFVEAFR
jgi:protein-tyrosine phosphatase